MLKLENNLSFDRKKYAVEAALLLGFQTEAAEFPIIKEDGTVAIPESAEKLMDLWTMESKDVSELPEEYKAATNAGTIYSMDFRNIPFRLVF